MDDASSLLIASTIAISLAAFVAYRVRVNREQIDSATLNWVGFLIALVSLCAIVYWFDIDLESSLGKVMMFGLVIAVPAIYMWLLKWRK